MRAAVASWRPALLDLGSRAAAMLCLAAAYGYAASGFGPEWLALLVPAALVLGVGMQHWIPSAPLVVALPWPHRRDAAINLAPGWILLGAAGAAKASGLPPRLVIWIWLAGTAWLLLGSWRLDRTQSRAVAPAPRAAPRWIWAMAVVSLAAAAPRVWEIGSVPRYVHCDEGTITFAAQAFYADPARDWFAPPANAGAYAIMNIYYALDGAGVLLGGLNLSNARASSVLLGIGSIVMLFDGLRRVAGLPVALVGALLLAANHCHVAYSRLASGYIQTAFVVALDFALASRLWTRPTYLNASALGIAAVIGVQTYPASLVSLPLLLAVFALQLLLNRERRWLMATSLALFLIACVSAGGTFAGALFRHGDALLARSRDINVLAPDQMAFLKKRIYHTESTAEVLRLQTWNSLRGFHRGRDHQPQYGIDQPLADPYTAALMIPGLLLALSRLPAFLATNALVWTVGYLLFGLGMQYAPGYNRTTGALPLAMVLPAIAVVQCATTLWRGRRRVAHWLVACTMAAVVATTVAINLRIYFVDYRWSRTIGDEQSEAGWIAREYADRYTIHLVGWSFRHAGYEGQRLIIADTPVNRDPGTDPIEFIDNVQLSGSDLFVVSGESPHLRDHLLARYPDARLERWQRDPTRAPVLSLIFIGPPRS